MAKIIAFGDATSGVGVVVGTYYADPATALCLTLGDNVYPGGNASEWAPNFSLGAQVVRNGAQWIFPTVGQHDWGISGAAGTTGTITHPGFPGAYHDYFAGKMAGILDGSASHGTAIDTGWYYYHDLPSDGWRIIHLCGVLNKGTNTMPNGQDNPIVSVNAGSPQYSWFSSRLDECVALGYNALVVWADPVYGTPDTHHSGEPAFAPFWQLLTSKLPNGAVVLGSHKHNYERFAKMNASGAVDAANGIVEYVVGTGGASAYAFGTSIATGSQYRLSGTDGVLELVLTNNQCATRFVPASGAAVDAQTITLAGGGTGPGPVPTAPTAMTATLLTSTSTTVTWTPPAGTLTGYTGRLSPTATVPGIGSAARSVDLSGLSPSTQYAFTLYASNAAGPGAAATLTFTTPAALAVPGAPTGLAASSVGQTSAVLSWTPPAGTLTGYRASMSPSGIVPAVGATARTVTVTGLAAGTTYTFTLAATSSVGTGANAQVTFTTSAVTAPSAPTGLAVSAVTTTGFTVRWTAPAQGGPLTGYTGTLSPPDGAPIPTIGPAATTVVLTALTPGTGYTFTLAASNASGPGASASVPATTLPAVVPPPPPPPPPPGPPVPAPVAQAWTPDPPQPVLVWQVYARRADRTVAGVLVGWTASLTLRFNEVGSWDINVPLAQCPVGWPGPGTGIIVVAADPDTGAGRVIASGTADTIAYHWAAEGDDTGDGTWTISGDTDLGRIAYRDTYPVSSLSWTAQKGSVAAYYTAAGTGETLLRNFVSDQAGPTALPARQVAGLTLAPVRNLGTATSILERFTPVLDVLRATARDGGGLGFDVVGDLAGGLTFVVYQPVDRTLTARFGVDLGNVTELAVSRQAPTGTVALVAAGGDLTARLTLEQAAPATTDDAWGRRELFVDQRQTVDPVQIAKAATDALAAAKEQVIVQAMITDTPSVRLLRDLNLGDLTTVLAPFGVITDVVRTITVAVADTGDALISATIGTDQASTDDLIAQHAARLERRLSYLERAK